jgi:hypothetical protein
MKLKQITLRTVRLPLIRPYALSYRTFNEFEPIIVEAGISTLRDRVCVTAAMLVLEPIFEADLAPELYAYCPGRNALQAVVEVEELAAIEWRGFANRHSLSD